jgi:hypothetical protein
MGNGGGGPRVSIVVPNWNSFEHLATCLDALADQTFRDFETVVVDNGSTDGSLEWLRKRSDVRVVELGSNRGFSAACNAGIAAGTSEYVVMLNNDTRADRDWLGHLVAAMDRSPEFGWAASMLVRFDDPHLIDSAGHAYSVWIGAARNLGEGAPAKRYTKPRRVFGATAAASIYRRSMLADIGGFDDEFFLIHEDTDLDLRANAAGYRCLYVPDAVVAHKRGSSYEVSPRIHLMGVRNRIWTTRSLPTGLLVLWMLTKVLRAFRWIPARLTGRNTSSRTDPSAWRDVPPIDVVRATLAALWTLPRKRREVRSTRRLSSIQLWRVLSETGLRAAASSNQY